MDYHKLIEWRSTPLKTALETRDKILTTDDLVSETRSDVFLLYILCCFSGLSDLAEKLLESYFDLVNDPNTYQPTRPLLDLLWKAGANARPSNCPWGIEDAVGLPVRPEFDITKPEFYQLDNWTETSWVSQTDYVEQSNYLPVDNTYDPHQWKVSDDPWTHAICARLLCRVPEGQIPDILTVRESFEAMDRLFTQLPRRKSDSVTGKGGWPHGHIVPIKIYFLLAYGLGERKKAREIFELACTPQEYHPSDLVRIPALYDVYSDSEDKLQLIAEVDAVQCVETLRAALLSRKQHGQQQPLHGVPWPELLQRFSEAAFKLHREDYQEAGEDHAPEKAADILLPPINEEELALVEARLGPLPPDFKEMVQIANGFRGSWHLFGGGFPRVQDLSFEEASEGHELSLGVEPKLTRSTTSTERNPDGTTRTITAHVYEIGLQPDDGHKAGPVWVGQGAVESDSFEHVVCPPDTWRRLMEAVGKGSEVEEGDYRVFHEAYWDGGGNTVYKGLRHWIASETAEMERELALQDGGNNNESDEGDVE